MTTYVEATTVRTATEIQSEIINDLANPTDPDLAPVVATGFGATSAVRGLIASNARARATEEEIRAEVVKSGFLVDVEGRDPAWVDRMVEGFFSESPTLRFYRLRATKARHLFKLTNEGTGGPFVISGPNTLEVQAIDGTRFRNVGTGTLPAVQGAELPLEFEASVAGLAGNIGPGEIFRIMGGALVGVSIANEPGSQTFAARADETNTEYVTRALAKWGTLAAGGHPSAVAYRILTGVETITKIGVRDDNPNGPGSVDVYLANASGPASPAECAAAQAVFGPYEPLGSRGLWRYLPAVAHAVSITATMQLDGTNPNAIADAESALDWLQAVFPMQAGKRLDVALVQGVLRGGRFAEYVTKDANGNEQGIVGFRGVQNVELSAPSADELLDVSEVLVLNVSLTPI